MLRSLVSGANSDAFAPTSGAFAGTALAASVPAQVVNLYQAAINDDQPNPIFPATDPADLVGSLVDQRASELAATLAAHIVPVAGARPGALKAHVQLSAQIAAPQTTGAVFAEENPYIGPTLDRLDETALVLNDAGNGTATTTGTPPTPAPPAASGTPTTPTTTAAGARCTLKVVSNKVLLAARKGKANTGAPKPGRLAVIVKCNQGGKVRLTGTLTQLIGAKPKHGKQKSKTYKLGPLTRTVKAGRGLTLMVKLPAAAVTALGRGAKGSSMFTVTLSNTNGAGRATVKIATLKGTR